MVQRGLRPFRPAKPAISAPAPTARAFSLPREAVAAWFILPAIGIRVPLHHILVVSPGGLGAGPQRWSPVAFRRSRPPSTGHPGRGVSREPAVCGRRARGVRGARGALTPLGPGVSLGGNLGGRRPASEKYRRPEAVLFESLRLASPGSAHSKRVVQNNGLLPTNSPEDPFFS